MIHNGPLEASHALIDDDRYDMVDIVVVRLASPNWASLGHLRDCNIASTHKLRLRSANELLCHNNDAYCATRGVSCAD